MGKRGFEEMNEMEKGMQISGLIVHVIMKRGKRISEEEAVKILKMTGTKAREYISKL